MSALRIGRPRLEVFVRGVPSGRVASVIRAWCSFGSWG